MLGVIVNFITVAVGGTVGSFIKGGIPEKYSTLQVRVCCWNVYFVNLRKEEQDEFIARAAR